MTALPAYVLLTLAGYAFLRRCIGLSDIALLGLLVLVALTYGCYLHTDAAVRVGRGARSSHARSEGSGPTRRNHCPDAAGDTWANRAA